MESNNLPLPLAGEGWGEGGLGIIITKSMEPHLQGRGLLVKRKRYNHLLLNYYRLKGGRFEYRAKALFKKKNRKALNDWPPASIAII